MTILGLGLFFDGWCRLKGYPVTFMDLLNPKDVDATRLTISTAQNAPSGGNSGSKDAKKESRIEKDASNPLITGALGVVLKKIHG
jgi:hypothetical protein